MSSRPAESTRSVSNARSAPRQGASTATSSWRAAPSSERSTADAPTRRSPQRASEANPDPQPREPDLQSAEHLPDASARDAPHPHAQRQQEAEEAATQQEREVAEMRAAEQRAAEQREAEQREAQQREAQQREAQQREAQYREVQERESATMRSTSSSESQMPYRNGGAPASNGGAPPSHVVPDLSVANGAFKGVPTSPSTPPHIASPARLSVGLPAADGVAEALQGSQMDSIIESVSGDKRLGGMSETRQPSSLVTNIRTNQMFQSIDVHDSVAEELLSATYASDTASMMSTMTGHEKVWAGAPAPKKKKTRTTFLNRLFSSKKGAG